MTRAWKLNWILRTYMGICISVQTRYSQDIVRVSRVCFNVYASIRYTVLEAQIVLDSLWINRTYVLLNLLFFRLKSSKIYKPSFWTKILYVQLLPFAVLRFRKKSAWYCPTNCAHTERNTLFFFLWLCFSQINKFACTCKLIFVLIKLIKFSLKIF